MNKIPCRELNNSIHHWGYKQDCRENVGDGNVEVMLIQMKWYNDLEKRRYKEREEEDIPD